MMRTTLLLTGLLLAGAVHADAAPRVSASQAWIRVLPGALPAGGYVTLHNDGDQPVALRGASSPAYGMAMLHQSSRAGGMSRMSEVASLTIPAHGTQTLAPGGYHLMLMDAKQPVRPGDKVRVLLDFGAAGTLPVEFLARPASALGYGDP